LGIAGAAAQGTGLQITSDLAGQLDFRDTSFRVCFEQPSCTVNGLRIVAERLGDDGEQWGPADIYWDPVDGFGVLGGGQDDEIDFDERLTISFPEPQRVARVWLSDLFAEEHRHYGQRLTVPEALSDDVEVAGMALLSGSEAISTATVVGRAPLPDTSFNQQVWTAFTNDGDLNRRVVIVGDVIQVSIPNVGEDGRDLFLTVPIGEYDSEKLGIFEGVETVEIEFASLLPSFNAAPVYAAGSHNAQMIEELLDNLPALESMRLAANQRASELTPQLVSLQGQTSVGSDNGEVVVAASPETPVTAIRFFAPFGTSNDFSVAGFVLAR
jgi:hypothetical protein